MSPPFSSTDTIACYLAKGCILHPIIKALFLTRLYSLQQHGKLCLTGFALLEKFHLNIQAKQNQNTNLPVI